MYKIDRWVPASQANNITREFDPNRHSDRIAFEGDVADENVRGYYIGRDVSSLYKWGEADPVKLFLKSDISLMDEDINVPIKPKNRVRKADGTVRYICGRCNASFVKATRCPECGQLIKE